VSATPLVIGTAEARPLSEALGADFTQVPAMQFGPSWSDGPAVEEWRNNLAHGRPVACLVVAVWATAPASSPVVGQGLHQWVNSMEEPFALWFAALSAAGQSCADNGQVVAVVDRPDPKSAAGWGAQAAVADAVEVMVRSLSLIHERRNVRVNTVTSPARLTDVPGERDRAEVVATVAMLLSQSVVGLNASAVHLGGDL